MYPHYLFADRTDAGEQLADALHAYKGRNPLVLAIPCGALPLGKIIAERLGGDLDIVLAHKLCAPFSDEYAIGGIDETGWSYLTLAAEQIGLSATYIEQEKARQLEVLRRRRAQIDPCQQPIDPRGRIAIVVDDGIATGATMTAALHALRAREPAELVCAAPVAARDSLEQLAPLADMVVCVAIPKRFRGVGEFYRFFPQVKDKEALQILKHTGAVCNSAPAAGAKPGQSRTDSHGR